MQRSMQTKRAGWSKQTSERCEPTSKQTSKWHSTFDWIPDHSGPQWRRRKRRRRKRRRRENWENQIPAGNDIIFASSGFLLQKSALIFASTSNFTLITSHPAPMLIPLHHPPPSSYLTHHPPPCSNAHPTSSHARPHAPLSNSPLLVTSTFFPPHPPSYPFLGQDLASRFFFFFFLIF